LYIQIFPSLFTSGKNAENEDAYLFPYLHNDRKTAHLHDIPVLKNCRSEIDFRKIAGVKGCFSTNKNRHSGINNRHIPQAEALLRL